MKFTVFIVLVFMGFAFYQVRNDFQPQKYLPVTDTYYLNNQDIQWRVSRLSYEYVPKQVATRLSALHTTELALDKKDIPQNPYTVLSGNMKVVINKNTAIDKELTISANSEGILQVNTYSFPGWNVYRNNQNITYSDANRLHLIQIPIQRGVQNISVQFSNTPVRLISNLFSLLSGFIWLTLFLLKKRFQK